VLKKTFHKAPRQLVLDIPEAWIGKTLTVTITPCEKVHGTSVQDRESIAAFFAQHQTTLGDDWKLDRGELYERSDREE
jgi:hypothetical protein